MLFCWVSPPGPAPLVQTAPAALLWPGAARVHPSASREAPLVFLWTGTNVSQFDPNNGVRIVSLNPRLFARVEHPTAVQGGLLRSVFFELIFSGNGGSGEGALDGAERRRELAVGGAQHVEHRRVRRLHPYGA